MNFPIQMIKTQLVKTVPSIIVLCLCAGCSSEVNFGGTTGGSGETRCLIPKFTLPDKKELAGGDEAKLNADMANLAADLKELEGRQESSSLNCTL